MGFVWKSAFWLGLVYSAMPFDAPEAKRDLSGFESSICANAGGGRSSTSSAYTAAVITGCGALFAAGAQNLIPVAAPPPARAVTTEGGSAHTLSQADKLPPWRGAANAAPKKRRTSS